MNLDTAAPLYVSKDCLNHHDYLLNKILDTAEIHFLTKGSMVFNSAEEINGLYVVLNGTLESFFYENGSVD